MKAFLDDTRHLLIRHIRTTMRQPIWIIVMLVQPLIWLLLFGQLFKRVVDIPGFGVETSYVQFLLPGIVTMMAFFGSAWSGMGMIEDINLGIIDRLLTTPASRVANAALTVMVQSVLILGLGFVLGARPDGGIGGLLALLVVAFLLSCSFAALSNGLALLARREETLIAVMNFLGMPLTFLSSATMSRELMPGWIEAVARFNPVNWAVEAGRSSMSAGIDWGMIGGYGALLAGLAAICVVFGTRALAVYRRAA